MHSQKRNYALLDAAPPTSAAIMVKYWSMKSLAVTFLLLPFAALAASTAALPSPEPCGFADTEAETNIVLAVDRARLDRVVFAMELTASATNCLEVAVGADADGDGSLSPEESDVAFGYDCGEWFLRGEDGVVVVEDAADGGRIVREVEIRKKAFSPEWNLVRVTRRGIADISECVSFTEEHQRFELFFR